MKTKVIALSLIITTALSLVSCNKAKDKNEEGATNISMLYMEAGTVPFKADWLMLKTIEEKKNVKLNLQVVPGKDFNQKRSILFSSGEIPDLVVNCWPAEMSQYAVDGILLPVSDHLDKLPNLKKIITDWDLQSTIDNISENDGKFYVLPLMKKELFGSQCFMVREDIYNKHNIPLPTTYNELLSSMTTLKQLYPESLGTGDIYKGDQMLSFIAEAFNTNSGYSLPFGYSYRFETNEWYFAPTSNDYKEMLVFMNTMYKNGCLDPEAFTQDSGQYNQKLTNSKYLVVPSNGPYEANLKTSELKQLGVSDAKFTALTPLAGPTGLRKVKPSSKNQGGIAMPSTIAKRKDFDKVMEFCDWLYYGEEAAYLSTIGFEGVTYDEKDSKYVMKPEIKTKANLNGTLDMKKEYGVDSVGLMSLVSDIVPEEVRILVNDKEQFAFEKYVRENNMSTEDDPIVKMLPEQREKAKLLITTLNDYTNQMKMKFIFGQESFDNWDKYISECEKKGSKELLELVTKAWKENNKK